MTGIMLYGGASHGEIIDDTDFPSGERWSTEIHPRSGKPTAHHCQKVRTYYRGMLLTCWVDDRYIDEYQLDLDDFVGLYHTMRSGLGE